MKYKSIIAILAISAACLTAGAQTPGTTGVASAPQEAVVRHRTEPLITTKIKLLTRTYGDSIVLRWAAEDFVSWKYLCVYGVNVLRVQRDGRPGLNIDTLAYGLKPLSLEQFRKKYPDSDSLALVPQGVLYGRATNYKFAKPGTMERSLEDNSEQDIAYGFAMVVAEWRKDLAEAMAVRFTDRNVTPGATYDYYIQPTRWDNGGKLIFEPGVAEKVVNMPYTPVTFDPVVIDSLTSPYHVSIGWWDHEHSSYEIERRMLSNSKGVAVNGPWQRVTEKPYISMVEQPEGEDYCLLGDSVAENGVYEYRIMGYDAFADLCAPTKPHRVVVRDIQPPSAPNLKNIIIERPDNNDPMAKVIAHFVWEKEEIEPDFVGYCINYSSTRITGKEWKLLNDDMIAPTATTYAADVTGLTTGMVCISAYDDSGNESRSFVQLIELRDYKAPDAPDSLRVTILLPEMDSLVTKNDKWAYAILNWNPCPDDDIDYYDISVANDTTHTFIIRNQGGIRGTEFIDSMALNVNQKYIYYKVRAVDYSTNIGPWSHWIEVERPHLSPPTVPHLDTSSHNDKDGMHMEWIVGTDADMKYHVAYRRVGEKGDWQVIGRYDHDSLVTQNYRIILDDNPPFDREQRYYYCVESHNSSPFTARSLAVSWLHRGPKVWEVPITLAGDYFKKDGHTRLVWEIGKLPFEGDYYYCIYRKGPGENTFHFVLSVPKNSQEYTDRILQKGESADYYVMIQWRDGRQSTPSNTITVTRPKD